MPDGFGSIDDLIQKNAASPQPSGTPPPSSRETQEKYEEKMHEIETKNIERTAEERAAELGVPYMNLDKFPIGPETLTLIPEETAQELKIVPFFRGAKEIKIAAVDPTLPAVEDLVRQLEEKTHVLVSLSLMSDYSLAHVLKLYATLPKIRKVEYGVSITEEELQKYKAEIGNFRNLQTKIAGAPVTDIVAMIIGGALSSRSSDVHVEAEEKDVKVRYRIDGILHDAATLPKDVWPKLINRVKLLAGVKLNITNKPQDGRFTIHTKEGKIDVRVSVLPTAYGESIVIRILASTAAGLTYDDLGIRGRAYDQLKKEIERPNGLIVTTGPTGSGKTTTLYAILMTLNTPDTKIITIEDPIELEISGVNQSQIDAGRGYTFANGLRSIVRQDPDIILVGEIRDLETAEISIQASLTGHLVLSTIHTNSAAGTIPRFLSMGAKPFLLAPAINAMMGQRLVRRICKDCKEEDTTVTPEQMEKVKQALQAIPEDAPERKNINLEKLTFFKGKGCVTCHDIGYKGRIGIYEIMIKTKELEKMILGGQLSEYDMQDAAVKNGMLTMLQDGILKALDGMTALEEVFRVAE